MFFKIYKICKKYICCFTKKNNESLLITNINIEVSKDNNKFRKISNYDYDEL